MESFNEYHLDPKQFPFLNNLQENWQVIRDEFTYFMDKASQEELQFTFDIWDLKVKR
jgi:beta-hydroxylase